MRSLPLFALIGILFNHLIIADDCTPNEALKRLIDGNERFSTERMKAPDRTRERRENITDKQQPFAIILGCADSRIPPEIVFDQGLGDLFVVRIAGNVVDQLVLDSIDYSVIVNHSSLILVLGHENCGAIEAVLQNQTKGFETLASLIEPAIKDQQKQPGNNLASSIKANANYVASYLRNSPVISKYISEGKVEVASAYYNFQTGKVEILNCK